MTFLIYGANGYTGELIAREAVRRGLRPVLSGRSADAIALLANELGLEARPLSSGQGSGLCGTDTLVCAPAGAAARKGCDPESGET